ncbi:ORF7 [Halorubrum pleomorphic virus 2]|uniref:ORF7 n=1 Tax=Halorubrum pleomorphic virus 2 TaxID=1156719 RepID=H9ABM1_9VIRU|nr:ORF7 [Halorubrum pleomorphic virus 2]AFD03991.1 ORF7 [Halorubrum pleomorphic virus 2]
MREKPDTNTPEKPRPLKLVDWLKTKVPHLVVGTIALAGAAAVFGFDIEIPRFWKVAGLAAAFMAPLGLYTGKKVTGWLYNPSWVWLIDLDARELDGGIFRFPEEDFRELQVLDDDEFINQSYDITQLGPSLYAGKQVDLEDMTVVGTWRGTLDDRELAKALRAVYECRGQLQDDAQEGFILKSSAFVVVRRATRNTVESIIETFHEGSLPDSGDGIQRAIDRELEDFGLDAGGDSLDDLVDDLDLDDAEHKSGFDFRDPKDPPERNGHAEPAEVSADD